MTVKTRLLFIFSLTPSNYKKGMLYFTAFFLVGFVYFALILFSGFGDFVKPEWKNFVYFIIFIPFAEEIIFRGILQKKIWHLCQKSFMCITCSNLVSSIFFAALHAAITPAVHSALVFFPSLLFGILYEKSGKILFPIALHAFFNLNVFIVYRSDILYIII